MSVRPLCLPSVLVLLLLVACADTTVVEDFGEDGVLLERYRIRKADSIRQGEAEVFDSEGALIERARYEDGELEGTRTRYYADGAIQAEETLRGGRLDGLFRSYYPDGQLELEGQYVDHVGTGTWTGYYPDGAKKEEVTMRGSLADGPFLEWHPNGNRKAEGTYVKGGKEDGELLLYDETGALERKMDCEEGVCYTTWPAELVKARVDVGE